MNFGACQARDEPIDENLLWDPTVMGAGTSEVGGGCMWREVWHPQRITQRGPNLRRGGATMLELRNVLNIKKFSGKLRSKKIWRLKLSPDYIKLVFEKFFGTFCFRKQNVDPLPPPANIFRKNFCFPENFCWRGGARNGRAPKFLNLPPQPDTGWHGPGGIR